MGVPGGVLHSQAPSFTPAITYLDDEELREKLYRANIARATEAERDNRPLLVRILELRREKATLLGFADFADFVVHDRMAHTGGRALAFLEDLKNRTDPGFARENVRARSIRRKESWKPWDVKLFRPNCNGGSCMEFDEEQLRPFFPAERVENGIFAIVDKLYGIQVRQSEGVPVWHPDVRYYEVHDGAPDQNGLLLGAFYAGLVSA